MYYYFNCKHCGKPCKRQKAMGVYCSRACQNQGVNPKTKSICPTCNKEFEYYKSWPRKYCSKACAGQAYSKDRANKVDVECTQCKKPLQRVLSRVTAHRQFCSPACRH